MFGAFFDLAGGVSRWRTSYMLAVQDIALRYRRSVLGPFWISASLVVSVLALAYVFSAVFQQDIDGYIGWVAGGLLGWTFISGLMNESCQAVIAHTSFLQNVPMPLSVIAARLVFRDLMIFAHNFVAMVAVLLVFKTPITPEMVMVFPGVLLIAVFGFFLVLVLGPICVRFRDIPQAVTSILQVIFYLTPIFWQVHPGSHRPMFTTFNPFFHFVQLVRAPLLGEQTTLLDWQSSLWATALVAVLAMMVVSTTRKRINLWL